MSSETERALERYFGHKELRPGQREAIEANLSGVDSLVVMPTGGGKSLCYQIPALVRPGLTLVVSPLISLMQDQVHSLQGRGVAAELINSSLSSAAIDERLRRAVSGELKLLYLAPERFDSSGFRNALEGMKVAMVAIDEAHCVSQWGHDFRPSYMRLRRVWPRIGRPPLMALTATATPEVRRAITKELGLWRPRVIIRGFDRPNLYWAVRREERTADKSRALISLLERTETGSCVVYASTRKMVEAATSLLRGYGVAATAYHAGLPRDQRERSQDEWMNGRVPVIVATNAFGMGIDKEDVRCVVHLQLPGSLEAYYQEAGRAGRDGSAAECVLLHSYRDRFTHEYFIRSAYPPRSLILKTYSQLSSLTRRNGAPVGLASIARGVRAADSRREVESALRILAEDGAIRGSAAGGSLLLRWIAHSSEVDALLANGTDGALSLQAVRLLAALHDASASGERRQLRLDSRRLCRLSDGDADAARSSLDELQAAGLIGWRDDRQLSLYEPVKRRASADELDLDWDRIAARRKHEIAKLRRMEKYAFQQGCRRRYLLRYFGESSLPAGCSGCDRCMPNAVGSSSEIEQ